MRTLLLLIFLSVCRAIDLKRCPDTRYKNMVFHNCSGLNEYTSVKFHDVTGENDIFLVNDKVYRNRGIITCMFKDGHLLIAKNIYTPEEWMDLFYNSRL